jgi:hypothetical protein
MSTVRASRTSTGSPPRKGRRFRASTAARIGGQLIWATRFEEVANTKTDRSGQGGKGMAGPKTVTTTYSYFANLAVGLCEGRIAFIRRIWADGREIDLAPSPCACTRAARRRAPIR